jgi:hypothetical protein
LEVALAVEDRLDAHRLQVRLAERCRRIRPGDLQIDRMPAVFGADRLIQPRGRRDVFAVVVDVLGRDPLVLDVSLDEWQPEHLARRLERVSPIGQHERRGTKVQQMPAKRPAARGQIVSVDLRGRSEAFDRAL